MDMVSGIERCLESRMNRMWGQIDCGSQRERAQMTSVFWLTGKCYIPEKQGMQGRSDFRGLGDLMSLQEVLLSPNTSILYLYV